MKFALMNLTANLVSLACVGSAVYLAVHDVKGWGWFLLVAALSYGAYRNVGKDENLAE